MRDKFTICVLLYGDYPQLADRCLRSIVETIPREHLNLRIGMNEVSAPVREWVQSWAADCVVLESRTNLMKYPLMRHMLHGEQPVTTPYVMWFDDDSYLADHKLRDGPSPLWLTKVEHAMMTHDLIGSKYTMPWAGGQQRWVEDQPWYNKRDHQKPISFCTGGWWCARYDVLRKFDYPWPTLTHRGGDTMLGVMCYQQGLNVGQFRDGVHINADEAGRESKADRRGYDSPPIGFDYVREAPGRPANMELDV